MSSVFFIRIFRHPRPLLVYDAEAAKVSDILQVCKPTVVIWVCKAEHLEINLKEEKKNFIFIF